MAEQAKFEPVAPVAAVYSSRRQFLAWGIAATAAAWAGVAAGSRLFPAAGEQEARPVALALAELPVGGSRLITYAGAPAVVIRSPEGIKAFSLICTHLGCSVEWQPERKQFHCPCHDGRFDQFGEVVSGPPPAPLEQLGVAVEGDRVVVGGV